MKKFILTTVAAAGLALGTAANAQDLGSVIANALGFGYSQGIPAVVAGTGQQQLYADQYGRQFYYDQYGRQVYINNATTPQIVGYDSWGRPVYGNSGTYAYGSTYPNQGSYAYGGNYRRWDRDGDGVANSQDRWPDDPRYR